MVNQVVAGVLFRIGLPLVLLGATLFRYNVLSFVYLILLLISPLLTGPLRATPLQTRTKAYLILTVALSAIFCLAHVIYQIVLLSTSSYDGVQPDNCGFEQRMFTLFGLHRLSGVKFLDVLRIIVTDFIVLIFSTLVYVICDKHDQQVSNDPNSGTSPLLESTRQVRYTSTNVLFMIFGEFFVLLSMAAAGILYASMFSLVYFISFLGVATWLACSRSLGSGYRVLRSLLLIFSAFHYIALYIYQFDYSQDYIKRDSLEARLSGLVALRKPVCISPDPNPENVNTIEFFNVDPILFVNPIAILLFYFFACTMTRYGSTPASVVAASRQKGRSQSLFHVESKRSSQRSHSSAHLRRRKSERPDSNLLENEQRNYDSMSPTHKTLTVDGGTSSSVWHSTTADDNELNSANCVSAVNKVSRWRQVYALLQHFIGFLFKGSYVITLIIMMAWSITYHSWLTFILLLWSCLLWMMPNSRMACLKASPFLVFYAEVLLICQFIYSLNLNDDELPTYIGTIKLSQIGLVKLKWDSYQALGIKITYTIVFWLTLRQYADYKKSGSNQEEESYRMHGFHNVSGEGAAPTARGSTSTTLAGTNLHIKRYGTLARNLLVRQWIWVVAIMLMVISLGGDKVVLYRIVYMVLFLFFILMYQFSYRYWINVMYGFLLTVIIYSMLVLILIYTYQFESFDDYWEKYLHIDRSLQSDIGLERYKSDPGSLLLKLLTPTIFLIVTIIQLHYFHKDFIRLNLEAYRNEWDRPLPTESTSSNASPNPQSPNSTDHVGKAVIQIDEVTDDDSPEPPTPDTVISKDRFVNNQKANTGQASQSAGKQSLSLALKFEQFKLFITDVERIIWRLLEIHMVKIIFFSVFCLSVYDDCAVHVLYVGFVVVALPLRGLHQFLVHCCSIWTSILLISKMIYQLKFVDSIGWDTNCTYVAGLTNASDPSTFPPPFDQKIDNRVWIGFTKTDHLTKYCKGYIALIVIFTINAVVKVHQSFERHARGEPEPAVGVVFPNVTRKMADADFIDFLKYMLNYFFYKFGVEICLVTMVACIGVRLDVFALLTAIWLCTMFLLRRKTLAKIWFFYVLYLCIIIPIQYIMVVGLPAGLCVEYPWYSKKTAVIEAVDWLFLPNFESPPDARKILIDFFQLLLACCQLAVFNLETGPEAANYPAGSNAEIYDPKGQFIGERPNPIPCFIGDTGYFNKVKTAIFFLFYWVTLAVMYLAGTNRISLFALFYILGCFFFLWNGNEFYLKPIGTLLHWWNTLIAYNVVVIFIKCILQFVGCVWMQQLAAHACWLVQLLGIACLKKLGHKKPGGNVEYQCSIPSDEAGLLWDGICFAFLLLQKRLFTSYYFHHLIIEILAQQELSSRGAEVMHYKQMDKVKQQRETEREIMEKIRMKMDRIRENQRKQREGEYVEPETHYQASYNSAEEYASYSTPEKPASSESSLPPPSPTTVLTMSPVSAGWTAYLDSYCDPAQQNIVETASQLLSVRSFSTTTASHQSSIRSGDYYLFDDTEQPPEPLDLVRSSKEDSCDDMEVKTKGLNAVLSNMMKGSTATRTRARVETGEEIGDSSGMSAIISIDRSVHTQSQASSTFPSTVISRPTTSTPSTQRDVAHIALTDSTKSPPSSPIPPTSPAPPAEDEVDGPTLTLQERIAEWLAVAKTLLDSMLVSGTAKLHSFSGGYREVAKLLDKDKQKVKLRYPDGIAILTEANQKQVRDATVKETSQESLAQKLQQIKIDLNEEALCESTTEKKDPYVFQFLSALIYAFYARTEIVCYMGIVFNQIKTASLLSLPLPFMVFLWGSLSVPRPSKTFWITIITYTEAIVVVKYLFQFDFFKWNSSVASKSPFDPPKILGIERRKDISDNYLIYDLILLFLVFLHRFVLKSLGLWKDTDRSLMDEMEGSTASEENKPDNAVDKVDKSSDKEKLLQPKLEKEKKPMMLTVERTASPAASSAGEASGDDEEICSEVEEDPDKNMSTFLEGIKYYLEPFKSFFNNLLQPPYQVTTDVYAWMFFCDFINFFIMVFGYWAFGTGGAEDGVASYFQKNEVPVPFLIMLLAQFALIVIDRALYLRKYILGKLFFQQALVLVIHIWMFFVLPALSQRGFAEEKNLPPKLWYFIKCVYLLLSAYQIRCGYPTRILGNFFTKKYNYLNYFLFKGYLTVPFLYELRSLMDWIWTDTSMVLANWLKMEDIFANIFQLKCQRRAEEEYPTPRGAKRSSLVKYGMGGTLLFMIILIIWFPLLLFSLGNTVGQNLPPQECQIQLSIGAYEPLFTISAQKNNMKEIDKNGYEGLQNKFKQNSKAMNYLANYDKGDIVIAMLSGNSTAVWTISPPAQEALKDDLLNSKTELDIKLKLTFFREKNDTDADSMTTLEVPQKLTAAHMKTRKDMATMLSGNAPDNFPGAVLPKLLPKYVHVPRKGPAALITNFEDENEKDPVEATKRNLTVKLLYQSAESYDTRTNATATYHTSEWWSVKPTNCSKEDPYSYLSAEICEYLAIVIFADKVFPQALSLVSSYGIVGLYTTFVLVASRVLRGLISNTSTRIMFDDMPNVDRVLQLCLDIYLVRESKELELEEDLFAKLVFLYRSPETLIKWTRMPTQQNHQHNHPPPPQPPPGPRPDSQTKDGQPKEKKSQDAPQSQLTKRTPMPSQPM